VQQSKSSLQKDGCLAGRLANVCFAFHRQGGHFAAMEKPKEMLEDMEEFIKTIGWPVK
jgi:hypothetical protein